MRFWPRAAIRAQLPLRWGQGFNPRPRISLPLPRPVGVASDDELLVLELEPQGDPPVELAPAHVLEKLQPQIVAGIQLLDARRVTGVPQPVSVEYVVCLDCGIPNPQSEMDSFLAATSRVIDRSTDAQGGTRKVDVRGFVQALEYDAASRTLRMTLDVSNAGTARPTEILTAIGLDAAPIAHRIVRTRVRWTQARHEQGVDAPTDGAPPTDIADEDVCTDRKES